MGLKSGSRDAGLDDSDESDDETVEASTDHDADAQTENRTAPETPSTAEAGTPESAGADAGERTSGKPTTDSETQSSSTRPTMESIPYKLRREKVNEGREQVPYFLREEVMEAEPELKDTLENLLGEQVYKSDYREAAMVVAQRNPELIADVLREWGYDLAER